MALSYSIEGKGVIANCDGISDSAGGTWSEQGGGTIALSSDVFLIGSSSIGGKYASKSGFHQYDLGSGNELDFTASTGTEAGQCLYIWVSMTALGTLDTLSTYPLAIRLSSSSPGTSNYIDYVIAGNDDKNGWDGGFRCFVIDPTKTPSRVSGTQSSIISSVRTVGVWIDCSTSARADSIFVDQMAVGSGLRITGTSTTGWADAVAYCTDYSTRGWGMLQEREGIYYAYGNIIIGDATTPQSSAVSFKDSGRVVQFGYTEYCTDVSTGTWECSMGEDFSGITIEDDTATTNGVTTFEDGVVVGSDSGRSGSTFIGNPHLNVFMDLYGGNNANSVTALYGTVLKDIAGAINSGNDTGHKFYSVAFSGCGQFDPVGAPVLRNCIFAESSDDVASLVWNSNIDIEDCKFIANTVGAATTATYYFDGSDSAASDPGGVWSNETNADDGSTTTDAENTTNSGTESSNYLQIEGTNATDPGGTPTSVRARRHNGSDWDPYFSLSEPSGGWTWTKIAGLEVRCWGNTTPDTMDIAIYEDGNAGSTQLGSDSDLGQLVSKIEIEVTYNPYISAIEHDTWNGTESGTVTTADVTGVTLTDSSGTFTGNAAVNDIVYNETDGSYATVVTVDSNTQITTDGLSGGTDNQFALSDVYSIATPVSYTDLTFSGNTYDVDNTTSPSNVVAISKAGTSNPATYPSGDYVVIQGSVSISITVKDEGGTEIEGAIVGVFTTDDKTELLNDNTNASGQVSATYAGSTPREVKVWIRKASSGDTKYKNFSSVQSISASGLTLNITMVEDTNNNATT